MHWKKVAVQTLLLVVGTVMLCAGALEGKNAYCRTSKIIPLGLSRKGCLHSLSFRL